MLKLHCQRSFSTPVNQSKRRMKMKHRWHSGDLIPPAIAALNAGEKISSPIISAGHFRLDCLPVSWLNAALWQLLLSVSPNLLSWFLNSGSAAHHEVNSFGGKRMLTLTLLDSDAHLVKITTAAAPDKIRSDSVACCRLHSAPPSYNYYYVCKMTSQNQFCILIQEIVRPFRVSHMKKKNILPATNDNPLLNLAWTFNIEHGGAFVVGRDLAEAPKWRWKSLRHILVRRFYH